MTHDDMIKLGVKWLQKPYAACAPYGHSSMTIIITELKTCTSTGEIPDAIAFSSSKGSSVLLEAKVSKSDFLADLRKPFRSQSNGKCGMGDQRWYIAPKGVIPVDKLPERWGLLEYDAELKKLLIARRCGLFPMKDYENEMRILCSAMCRLRIDGDSFIAIRVYQDFGMSESKSKAQLYIEHGADESVD